MPNGDYRNPPLPGAGRAKLPDRFRAQEFSLGIDWRPYCLTTGSRESHDDMVPGFYLQAMFANEGIAHDVLSDNPNVGKPAHVLLTPQTLQNVLTTLASDPSVPGYVMNLGGALNDKVESAQRARLNGLVTRVRLARKALAAQEQALRDAGMDPEAV